MAQLLVRNLDDDVKARLRVLAAEHGRSMEEEVRAILRQAVEDQAASPAASGTRYRRLVRQHNGLRDRRDHSRDLRGEFIRPSNFD